MTIQSDFIRNAKFTMVKHDDGRAYISGTVFGNITHEDGTIEKTVRRSISQHVPPEDLDDATDFCETGKGNYADKIRIGKPQSHTFSPSTIFE